MSVTEESVH